MTTPSSRTLNLPPGELTPLLCRYRRLLKFDRIICLVYCATTTFPLYGLFTTRSEWGFYITGTLFILLIGIAGITVDGLVLNQSPRAEAKSYFVTIGFVVSRLILAVWAVAITHAQLIRAFAAQLETEPQVFTFADLASSTIHAVLSPPVVGLAFILGTYRVIYHIAVHFYLRLAPLHSGTSGIINPAK